MKRFLIVTQLHLTKCLKHNDPKWHTEVLEQQKKLPGKVLNFIYGDTCSFR